MKHSLNIRRVSAIAAVGIAIATAPLEKYR